MYSLQNKLREFPMTELRTKPELLRALQQASRHRLSANELKKQRVSFIMGGLSEKSGVTRSRVKEVLEAQEGTRDRK